MLALAAGERAGAEASQPVRRGSASARFEALWQTPVMQTNGQMSDVSHAVPPALQCMRVRPSGPQVH